jgi:hypothetical protein
VPSSFPPFGGSATGSDQPSLPSDSTHQQLPWFGFDRLGLTQALGGLALGLIALFSSYDHLTLAGRNVPIPQQWGIPLIAASVAIVFVDAELASRSRLRAADERQSDRDRAEQRENEADRERNRAAEARDRQVEATERQRKSLERLDQAAVLSARVQLDPSDTNRARLQTFLNLLSQSAPIDPDL